MSKLHFRAAQAGIAYFAIIFAAGFILGPLRILMLVPAIGEFSAVLLELPVMLGLAWMVSLWLVGRFKLLHRLAQRLIMGGLGFLLLVLGEIGISTVVFEQSVAEFFVRYREPSAMLGLAGQLAFAIIPVVQLTIRR